MAARTSCPNTIQDKDHDRRSCMPDALRFKDQACIGSDQSSADNQAVCAAVLRSASPAAIAGSSSAQGVPSLPETSAGTLLKGFNAHGTHSPEQQQHEQCDSQDSQTDCAMGPDDRDYSSTVFGVHMPPGGWFKKCRGCGNMTVYEIQVMHANVPFCMHCQERSVAMQASQQDGDLWAALLYVHDAWSAAGV